MATQDKKQGNFMISLKDALKQKNYLLLLLAFAMVDGSFIAFGSILGPLFYGIFPPSDTSIVCGATTALGLIMSFISGVLIQRK